MAKRTFILLFALLFLSLVASVKGSELPQVVHPNGAGYSEAELASLIPAIEELSELLGGVSGAYWACRQIFSSEEWQSDQFAAYTAGILSELGYDVLLVRGNGWDDGGHTWVLAGIPLTGGRTAWIPVEASPALERTQEALGSIPVLTDEDETFRFSEAYLGFVEIVECSDNLPPVAKIHTQMDPVFDLGESARFSTLGSYDPDGEIVRYHWDLGDGSRGISDRRLLEYTFGSSGIYTVTLTVIDDGGKSAVATLAIRISRSPDAERPPGCGCKD